MLCKRAVRIQWNDEMMRGSYLYSAWNIISILYVSCYCDGDGENESDTDDSNSSQKSYEVEHEIELEWGFKLEV